MKTFTFILLLSSILNVVIAQPINNDCSNAIIVDAGQAGNCGPQVAGTLVGATVSNIGLSSCADPGEADVFYKFVANSENLQINLLGSEYDNFITVYQNDCGSFSEVGCTSFTPTSTSRLITGLTIGAVHYMKFQSANHGSFAFCLESPDIAQNNSCAGAEYFEVGLAGCAETINLHFQNYNNSDIAKPSCTFTSYQDAWYRFTAPPSGTLLFNSNTDVNMLMIIMENNCGSPTEVRCFGLNGLESDHIAGLSPGFTYLLRLSTLYNQPFGFDYSFCVEQSLAFIANDECVNAINLPISSNCNPQSVLYEIASPSIEPTVCDFKKDVWYTFTAPSIGSVILEEISGSISYSLYEGNCGSLTELDCNFVQSQKTFKDLTPTQTYILRIRSNSSFPEAAEFCLREGMPSPTNDECSGAISLPVNSTSLSSCSSTNVAYDLLGSTNSGFNSECIDDNASHCDLWYSFVAPNSQAVSISVSISKTVTLFTGSCGSLLELSCGEGMFTGLSSGATYYIMLSGSSPTLTDGNICIKEESYSLPFNDKCLNATSMANGISENMDISEASYNSVFQDCQFGTKDRWYSFTSPSSGNVKLKRTAGNSLNFSLYSGSCNSTNFIDCFNGYEVIIQNLTPGSNYLIRAFSENNESSSSTSYELQYLANSPNNKDCGSAIGANIGPSCNSSNSYFLDFDLAGKSITAFPSCHSSSSIINDLWFKFIAPASGNIQIISNSTKINRASVYTNTSCSSPNEVSCNNVNFGESIISDLVPGNAYLLQLIGSDTTSFCLIDPIIALNDNCNGALSISPGMNSCSSTNSADFTLSTKGNQISSCSNSLTHDLWYEFLSPPSGKIIFKHTGGDFAYFSLYQNNCSSLNELDCFLLTENSDKQMDGLIPNQSYFVQLVSSGDRQLEFCLQAVPEASSSSFCQNATPLIQSPNNNCSNIVSSTTIGAGLSNGNFCHGETQVASFMEVSPNEDGYYDFMLVSITKDHFIEVFTDCSLENSLGCGENALSIMLNGATSYTVAVYAKSALETSPFKICFNRNTLAGAGQKNVGIGTDQPITKLQVTGGVRPGFTEVEIPGNIRYSSKLETFQNGEWKSLTDWDHQADQNIDMNWKSIKNLNEPLTQHDAATKKYVDSFSPEWDAIENIPAEFFDGEDNVDDADNDPENEAISDFSISGNTLTITEGGDNFSADLSDLESHWNKIGSNISYMNGQVGIGNSSPNSLLDIYGDGASTTPQIKITETGSTDGARINFLNSNSTNAWTLYGHANNTASSSRFNIFHPTGGNIVSIKGSGDVGIGGVPSSNLHIYHSNNAGNDGLRIQNLNGSNYMRFYVSNSGGQLLLYSDDQGASIGNFDDASGAYTSTSDRRLKENFEILHFDWDSFMLLEPLSYDYISEQGGNRHIGLVAQDVEKIYPELVSYHKEDDVYHMNYGGFGVVAIKAIQELKTTVEKQEALIEKQAALLELYGTRIDQLESLIQKRK